MRDTSLLLCASLLLTQPTLFAQADGAVEAPTLHLKIQGNAVPMGTRVVAKVSAAGRYEEFRTAVGERGSLDLWLKREFALARRCRIRLFVGFLPGLPAEAEKTWYYREQTVDMRSPMWFFNLEARKASFLGSGRLLDNERKPIAGAHMSMQFMGDVVGIGGRVRNKANSKVKPDAFIDVASVREAGIFVGSDLTDAKGRFEIWSTRSVDSIPEMELLFTKRGRLGRALFAWKTGTKGRDVVLPVTHAVTFEVALPLGLPLSAVRAHMLPSPLGSWPMVTGLQITRLKEELDRQVWKVACDPLPKGTYQLWFQTAKGGVDFWRAPKIEVDVEGVHYPRGDNKLDWRHICSTYQIRIADLDSNPLAPSWVAVHARRRGESPRLVFRTDRQGRAQVLRLMGDDYFTYWARGHRFAKARDPQSGQTTKLKPVPVVEFRVPELFAMPHAGIEIFLSLDPQFTARTPMPPPVVRDGWTQEIGPKGIARMTVEWYGPMEVLLQFFHKKTGEGYQMPATLEAPLRRLDRRKTPVKLDFDKKLYEQAMKQMGIRK